MQLGRPLRAGSAKRYLAMNLECFTECSCDVVSGVNTKGVGGLFATVRGVIHRMSGKALERAVTLNTTEGQSTSTHAYVELKSGNS